MRARLRPMASNARYSRSNAASARAVSCASNRQARTVRACEKLSVSSDAASPMRSCMPPELRRMRWPMRWMGRAASGYRQAAIRLSSQSRYSIEATSPTTVTESASPLTAPGHRLADGGGVGGEACGERGRCLALHPGEVGVRQVGEHAQLQAADGPQHDLLRRHALEVLRERLNGGDGQDQQWHLVEDPGVLVLEHVDRPVDQDRVQRLGAGHEQRGGDHRRQLAPLLGHMLAPQAPDEREGVAGGLHGRGYRARASQWPVSIPRRLGPADDRQSLATARFPMACSGRPSLAGWRPSSSGRAAPDRESSRSIVRMSPSNIGRGPPAIKTGGVASPPDWRARSRSVDPTPLSRFRLTPSIIGSSRSWRCTTKDPRQVQPANSSSSNSKTLYFLMNLHTTQFASNIFLSSDTFRRERSTSPRTAYVSQNFT